MTKAATRLCLIHKDNALTCQWCGSITTVKDSRPDDAFGFTTTIRRRSCMDCNRRYNTIEVTTRYYEDMAGIGIPERVSSIIHMLRAFVKHVDAIESHAPPSK